MSLAEEVPLSPPRSTVNGLEPDGRGALPSSPLEAARFARARTTYLTRFVDRLRNDSAHGYGLVDGAGVAPRPGDVVLARVGTIGQTRHLELPCGRRTLLAEGDEVVVAYGGRYATEEFEADVPDDLLVASLIDPSGLIGRLLSARATCAAPTALHPLGLVADRRGLLTTSRCAPYRPVLRLPPTGRRRAPLTVAVTGTAMGTGKTAALAAWVRGLTAAGLDVVAGQVNGTGSAEGIGRLVDAGALRALDLTDFGYPSSSHLPPYAVSDLFTSMHAELAGRRPHVILLEVAGGLSQSQPNALISDQVFVEYVDGVLLAAGDPLAAVAGATYLARHEIRLLAGAGVMTGSPLAVREARAMLDRPVLTDAELADPKTAVSLLPKPATGMLYATAGTAGRARIWATG